MATGQGVITRALAEREVAHHRVTELEVVETMHERKASMADAADAFVMLPGGFGTLDEFFEALTWTQLGVHAKAPAPSSTSAATSTTSLSFLDTSTERGLPPTEHRPMVIVDDDPERLLERMAGLGGPDRGRRCSPPLQR